jgi:replication factor C small subunit
VHGTGVVPANKKSRGTCAEPRSSLAGFIYETTEAEDMSESAGRDQIWIEKYRPETLSNVVGQAPITERLQEYVDRNDLPNLLFAGPAGVGKTASAVAIAKELYGDDWQDNFLELNASDDRGIDVVRERIKDFARTSFGGYDHRLIFLDEADALTQEAQSALRRTMEQFSNNVRFILSCNYSSQIIDPIQSRCAVFRFRSLGDDAVAQTVRDIAEAEEIEITEDGVEALVYAADGDMRRAINGLQAASVGDRVVDESAVYEITATARPEEIREMVEAALDGEFTEARAILDELLTEKGLAGGDVIDQLHRSVWDFDIDDEDAVHLLDRIGEADYRIAEGANERVQLEALLASVALQA